MDSSLVANLVWAGLENAAISIILSDIRAKAGRSSQVHVLGGEGPSWLAADSVRYG